MFLDPGSIARPATGGERGGPIGDVRVSLGRDKDLEKILRQRINALAAKKLTIYPRR
jgi:hypothetical protein